MAQILKTQEERNNTFLAPSTPPTYLPPQNASLAHFGPDTFAPPPLSVYKLTATQAHAIIATATTHPGNNALPGIDDKPGFLKPPTMPIQAAATAKNWVSSNSPQC